MTSRRGAASPSLLVVGLLCPMRAGHPALDCIWSKTAHFRLMAVRKLLSASGCSGIDGEILRAEPALFQQGPEDEDRIIAPGEVSLNCRSATSRIGTRAPGHHISRPKAGLDAVILQASSTAPAG